MPTYQRSAVRTIDDIRAIADHAGSHFFDPATMRFFSSRLLDGVYAPDGYLTAEGRRYFFVTSERHGDDAPRHYAVRVMTLGSQRDDRPYVDIATVGDYHDTARAARAAAQREADTIRYIDAAEPVIGTCIDCNAYEDVTQPDAFLRSFGEGAYICPLCAEDRGIAA